MAARQCPQNMSVFQTCLTLTMQFYNGLHSLIRQMSDVSLSHFTYTALAQVAVINPFFIKRILAFPLKYNDIYMAKA